VRLASGQPHGRGYLVLAREGSIRRPRPGETERVRLPWRAEGQFLYLNWRTGALVRVHEQQDGPRRPVLEEPEAPDSLPPGPLPRVPYRGGIPGLPRDDPEAQLVDAYVRWINDRLTRFEQHYLRGPGFHTDLFDCRFWRLIEAKVDTDRGRMREALGQLYDYKRYYLRGPSLAVLVPEKPPAAIIEYLARYRITVIWQTPSGRFSDTADGRWTERVRAAVGQRR
jgi:hypothetical protein